MKKTKLMLGDNMESLKKLPDNSIDSVITDGPYGLSFMGKKWDYDVPSIEFWSEVYRVLKPGGHALSFGGTRTYHRMVVNIEDASFEIRDQIQWIYGSGFPKSHNIGKAVDKLQGNDRELGKSKGTYVSSGGQLLGENTRTERFDTKGQSEFEGWGTALKPANEPICLARKPLSEKSVAENVLKWGTGGINIDGCRVGSETITTNYYDANNVEGCLSQPGSISKEGQNFKTTQHEGRFPANIILECICEGEGHTNADCPCRILDEQSGGASRFFYQAKVSKAERNMGLDEFEEKEKIGNLSDIVSDSKLKVKNNHPTVKPVSLMTYLVRMVTPPNGIVLDPFMGSGSTGIAAQLEGFRFVGMEMDENYFKIAEARINNFEKYKKFIK